MNFGDYYFDYERLNEILKRSRETGNLLFNEQVTCLTRVILGNVNSPLKLGEFNHKILPREAFDLALEFFLEINPLWAYQFQNIMKEKRIEVCGNEFREGAYSVTVKTVDNIGSSRGNVVESNGAVTLTLRGNITDVGIIVHEFIHKFSKPRDYGNIFRYYLSEVPSLAVEFVLYEFLLNYKSQYKDDAKSAIKLRFCDEINTVLAIATDCELYGLFVNNGRLDDEILRDFCSNQNDENRVSKIVCKTLKSRINFIIKAKRLSQIQNVRHLIGFVLACDFYSKFKKDSRELENIFKLNDILGNGGTTMMTDLEKLQEIGFGIFKDLSSYDGDSIEELAEFGNPLYFNEDILRRYANSFEEVYSQFSGGYRVKDDNIKK